MRDFICALPVRQRRQKQMALEWREQWDDTWEDFLEGHGHTRPDGVPENEFRIDVVIIEADKYRVATALHAATGHADCGAYRHRVGMIDTFSATLPRRASKRRWRDALSWLARSVFARGGADIVFLKILTTPQRARFRCLQSIPRGRRAPSDCLRGRRHR